MNWNHYQVTIIYERQR